MKLRAFIILTILAPFLFPAIYACALALASAIFSSFTPLAVGILLDTLYYNPHAFSFPLYSVLGGLVALLSLFVRRFVETSIMR